MSHVSLALSALLLIGWRVEGLICIVMAAPLAAVAASIGATTGCLARYASTRAKSQSRVVAAFFPLLLIGESAVPDNPPIELVQTEIVVQARPE